MKRRRLTTRLRRNSGVTIIMELNYIFGLLAVMPNVAPAQETPPVRLPPVPKTYPTMDHARAPVPGTKNVRSER